MKMSKRQVQMLRNRSNRLAESFYNVRYSEGVDEWGFMLPLPPRCNRDDLHDMTIRVPLHWQILAICYFEDAQGGKYREWSELRTDQRFIAMENGVVPFIEAAMSSAESGGNHNHIVGRAVILKPWSRQWPTMEKVLRRYQERLGLSLKEIETVIQEQGEQAA